MSKEYNPKQIEQKWQKKWADAEIFRAKDDTSLKKFYALVEFPYPSGKGLHVGHPRPYTAMDCVARKKRMQGYNVLFPIGWDAFGLPTENYAIQNNIHPAIVTKNNVDNFREQLKLLGLSFDYSREVNTTDPSYYKWTQWIFLRLFEKGLAYKDEILINYCPSCQVGLANEEVVNGACERCGNGVVRKTKSQWMLRITDYAQKLLDGLDEVDFIDRIKIQQRNWIGRSEGAELEFEISDGYKLKVFTTRPDTIYGATYMVVSPEHDIINKFADKIENLDEIYAYQKEASFKSDMERTDLSTEKTGVHLRGISAVNPVTDKEIPIFISDYVLMSYGTGAIMAVPGHDSRDWEFAKKFNLPIVEVVSGGDVSKEAYSDCADGVLVNSGILNGLKVPEAKEKIIKYIHDNNLGKKTINYKLRDWVFSRQRYWGEPIPLVNCQKCGWVALADSELPLMLPDLEEFKPGTNGESPLADLTDWVNTTCPKCGGHAVRETDTMPQWAGSSWYFLRYTDPHNSQAFASDEALNYWMPVDWYNGGMEHVTLHLLYSRFWHRFLYDIGLVSQPEPYLKRTSHGMILGENGEKMSKSRGNIVNPDDVIAEFGADSFRTYELFMGAFEQSIPWSTNGVSGCSRFLHRVWRLTDMMDESEDYSPDLEMSVHLMIKKVSHDYEALKFNTAIAAMMSFINDVYHKGSITKGELKALLLLLSPVASHICEEIWQSIGMKGFCSLAPWPSYDEDKCVAETYDIAIQVNGKVRGRITVATDADEEEIKSLAMSESGVVKHTEGQTIRKIIIIKGKIVNIVV